MHTFLQKKIFFCDTSARSFGVTLFVYFHACLFSLTPHTYKILKFWHSFYNTYLTKLFSRNEASMGAESIENKALLDMCYKNCARTSILYVCLRPNSTYYTGLSSCANLTATKDQKHRRHQAEVDLASPVAVLISFSRNS